MDVKQILEIPRGGERPKKEGKTKDRAKRPGTLDSDPV